VKALSAVLVAALGVTAWAQQAPQPASVPVFGVEVETVYVDAFVTHDGSPIADLSALDFELRDNGVPQRLEVAAQEHQPLLAVLAFDMSGSVFGEKLPALRAASDALLESLHPEDEAALFSFSDSIRWLARPTKDKQVIRKALNSLRPGGASAILDALYAAIALPNAKGRSLVVLFTDGEDNLSFLDWKQVRTVAERSNALIHVVSLRPPSRPAESPSQTESLNWRIRPVETAPVFESQGAWSLRQIAETTGGRYWEAASLDRLKAAFQTIAEAMSQRYVFRYSPENVKRAGWHKLELKLRGKKGDVRTRTGYWVPES